MLFETSISTEGYKEKPSTQTIEWNRTKMPIDEFKSKILNGYSFCGTYYNTPSVYIKGRTQENFKQIQYLAIDIDDTKWQCEFMPFINILTYKPTFAYTTFSHKLPEKGYRYRLVYFFDKPIKGTYQYQGCYDVLRNLIERDILNANLDIKLDNAMRLSSQPIHGTSPEAETYSNEVLCYDEVFTDKLFIKNRVNTLLFGQKFISKFKFDGDLKLSEEFMADFCLDNLKAEDLLQKYSARFSWNVPECLKDNLYAAAIMNLQRKSIVHLNDDEPYRIIDYNDDDNDSFEIVFYRRAGGKLMRYYDGQGRKRLLFRYGALMRLVWDEITLDELVFNIWVIRNMIMNTTDMTITRKTLIEIAQSVMSYKLESLRDVYRKQQVKWREDNNKKMYRVVVNEEWCKEHYIQPKAVKGIANEYMRMKKVSDTVIIKRGFYSDNIAQYDVLKRFVRYVSDDYDLDVYRGINDLRRKVLEPVINDFKTKHSEEEVAFIISMNDNARSNFQKPKVKKEKVIKERKQPGRKKAEFLNLLTDDEWLNMRPRDCVAFVMERYPDKNKKTVTNIIDNYRKKLKNNYE